MDVESIVRQPEPAADLASVDIREINNDHHIVLTILRSHFDQEYYSERYPDIDVSVVDPLLHYCAYGWKEGRDPSPAFASQQYLDAYPDVADLGINPLLHWLLFGRQEGRKAFAVPAQQCAPELRDPQFAMTLIVDRFDTAYYRRSYPDVDHPGVNALEHFCLYGWREKRNPAAWFSTNLYLAHHQDVAANEINPFVHYIATGEREQRRIFPADTRGPRKLLLNRAASLVASPALRDLVRCPAAENAAPPGQFDAAHLRIHWLIPHFEIGSGGHMTIFRIVHLLEMRGHACCIWIDGHAGKLTAAECYDTIGKNVQSIRAMVAFSEDGFSTANGDVVFATGWQTVAKVRAAAGFRVRAYFVQDFEPAFYPVGSEYLAAESTYRCDLAYICASPWLAKTMSETYGRWARHFWLAYDEAVYFPGAASRAAHPVPRIAVYARTCTARRSVELVLLALEQLASERIEFHVDLFGADIEATSAPYSCTLHGILDAEGLARLYRECDFGICFSTTNYSLVPKEMMACGLPVLEIDRDSTRVIFPSGVVTFCAADPLSIAQEIKAFITDRGRRARQAAAAARWISGFSWEKSTLMIESALIERLVESGNTKKRSTRASRKPAIFASVCIPAFNGGPALLELLDQIRSQQAPWPFEIVVVDSSSTDGTAAQMQAMPDVVYKSIKQEDFGHGRTRNLCAKLASGEVIAFLTQDAMPTNSSWLFNLVSVLLHFPGSAGAFGRHVAARLADPFTERDIDEHFKRFLGHPLAVSRDTDPELWGNCDRVWRKFLHFFSDNNSCLRRSAWEAIPYPDIAYGEDQVWADRIIAAGWEKIYVPTAVVRHSHSYTPAETRLRAATEAKFFREEFGYAMLDRSIPLPEQVARMDLRDRRWAEQNNVSAEALEKRFAQNRARVDGFDDDRCGQSEPARDHT
jgi:glycosyltransferase involved in cell wall biosynthesis